MKKIILILGSIMLLAILILLGIREKSEPSVAVVKNETEEMDRSKTFIIGTASESVDLVEEDTYMYGVLAKYISEKLSSKGITGWKVVNLVSISGMAQLMRQGRIDLLIDSPFPTYVINKLSGAEPIALRWKDGYEKYNTIIYAKASSGIKALGDLKGKLIVFEDPYSTSGYFLPKTELQNRKYTLVEKSPGQSVGKNEIGYYFSEEGRDEVDKGRAAAAVEIGYKFEKDSALNSGAYVVLMRTVDVYRHVVITRSDLDPALKSAIISILLNMDKDEGGKEVLKILDKTSKFTTLPDMNTAFDGVRELTTYVEQEIISD